MRKIHKNDFDGYLKFKSKELFNKKSGRDLHYKRSLQKDKKIRKIISNIKNQEFRKCLVCGSSSNNLIFNKNGFNHVACRKCNFVFVNPILKLNIQNKILKNENSYTKVMNSRANIKLDSLKFHYGLQKIKSSNKNKKILDFGTGYGFFLNDAKKLGWDCYASELNKDCLKILKKKKINIDNDLKKNFYDAITLWLVLEHIPYPNELFRKIYNSLKKNGKVLINVPNINSLSATFLRDKCTMFSGEQHINFFSKETIKKFLTKNNFKVLSTETIISDAGEIKNFLSYNNNLTDVSKKLYSFTDPDFIHKNMLGYTLLTIAKKK